MSMQTHEDGLRAEAVKHLKARRELASHALTYVLVNATLVVIWAMTGAEFFWPAIPMLGWGIGLMFHAWDVLSPAPSEARIQAEMQRIAAHR